MDALIAAMLRRSATLLDRLDWTTCDGQANPAGPRALARTLHLAADLLDRAATLAADAVHFVGEFDRHWRDIRHQVVDAVALTASPATARERRPR